MFSNPLCFRYGGISVGNVGLWCSILLYAWILNIFFYCLLNKNYVLLFFQGYPKIRVQSMEQWRVSERLLSAAVDWVTSVKCLCKCGNMLMSGDSLRSPKHDKCRYFTVSVTDTPLPLTPRWRSYGGGAQYWYAAIMCPNFIVGIGMHSWSWAAL